MKLGILALNSSSEEALLQSYMTKGKEVVVSEIMEVKPINTRDTIHPLNKIFKVKGSYGGIREGRE